MAKKKVEVPTEAMYAVIDVTESPNLKLLAVTDLRRAQAMGMIQRAAGRTMKAPILKGSGFSKFDLQQLQYLWWNLTGKTPADVYANIVQDLLTAIQNLTPDATPLDVLEGQVALLYKDGNTAPAAIVENGPPPAVTTTQTSTSATPKEPKPPRVPKAPGSSQRPTKPGLTIQVWEISDNLLKQAKVKDVTKLDFKKFRDAVFAECEKLKMKPNTISTQFSRWKAEVIHGTK